MDPRVNIEPNQKNRFDIVAALKYFSIAALIWALGARMLGPSDAYDQTQPKTMAYTTDIIVNGNWILPIERGKFPATKPPIYNWLAVPMVKLMGFDKDFAHKSPSVLALCLCWLVMVRLGRRLDSKHSGALGWLTGMMLASNYMFFKLGYLARPDMVLTLWLVLGWITATILLLAKDEDLTTGRRTALAGAFWLCVLLAALTKGPPAIVLPLYALIAAKPLGGSLRKTTIFGWWWGLPLCIGVFGLWVWGVFDINPEHLKQKLWFDEIAGRITGLGDQGNTDGPIEFFRRIIHMPLYFLTRFAPWSVISIIAMFTIWTRTNVSEGAMQKDRRWRKLGELGSYLNGAAIFVIIIICVYTLSTGKRADYIAAAFAPGALLTAWWILQLPERVLKTATRISVIAAITTLLVMTLINEYKPLDPAINVSFGDDINEFIHEAQQYISETTEPIVYWAAGTSHLQGHLGSSVKDGSIPLLTALHKGQPFWLVAGQRGSERLDISNWLIANEENAVLGKRCSSKELPRYAGWPGKVTLYWVVPVPK